MADYTRCRTYGHALVETMDSDWRSDRGIPLTLRCERCPVERHDVIDRATGEVVSRRYIYPKDYQYARGTRPSRAEFRLILLAGKIAASRQARKRARN